MAVSNINLEDLEERLNRLSAAVKYASEIKETAEAALLTALNDLAPLREQGPTYKAAAAALQAASNRAREEVCKHLESLATSALQYVYGDDFNFTIELATDKLGRPSVSFYVESNGVKNDPLDARGGGVVDIISIALRLGMAAIIQNPPPSGPLLLDEPGRHLDLESAMKLGEFLRAIARTSNRQIIMVTHHSGIAFFADPGGAFKVTQNNGVSSVESKGVLTEIVTEG